MLLYGVGTFIVLVGIILPITVGIFTTIKEYGWIKVCKGWIYVIIGIMTIASILTVIGMIGTSIGLTSENMRDGYRSIFGLPSAEAVRNNTKPNINL